MSESRGLKIQMGGKVEYSLAGRQACLHRKPGPRSAATPSTPSPAAGSGRSGTWRWSCCLWRFGRCSQCCRRSNWWDTKTTAMWTQLCFFVLILLGCNSATVNLCRPALPSPRAGSLPTLSGTISSMKLLLFSTRHSKTDLTFETHLFPRCVTVDIRLGQMSS